MAVNVLLKDISFTEFLCLATFSEKDMRYRGFQFSTPDDSATILADMTVQKHRIPIKPSAASADVQEGGELFFQRITQQVSQGSHGSAPRRSR